MSAIRQTTKEKPRTVFYIDVDNTLLDNDHIKDKIKAAWELMATGTKTLLRNGNYHERMGFMSNF
ncbi:hypothetical protein COW99_00025 [Candidatus Roizmanbacteria bacterium CG22_combo_CG10-13_8_21_14_all_38_20]|uniref:Uncharacterized protein n=1 Tax=Candidatus Roizmanbacteria bacterium CG22_combo_CG10-13_8_21_14_all_38_20 TaxID=1974862 RepID=A0A2H0BWY0_9BACT|nr:MAG: hypothetical protein COW99_00025 [Candidatus Roizmanbacteria bacterium CG22_combo_CG10-13_8_21_14_all_38_20]PJC32244.1 MAG: hypothetical protein CO050_00730 [Candidatus Roizmanbacteria bacterium CG_4_9_14_0_2_um_filter_38_17]